MKTLNLKNYPRLDSVLSPSYKSELTDALFVIPKSAQLTFLNTYSAFIDIVKQNTSNSFCALILLNNQELFDKHLCTFIGFIQEEVEGKIETKNTLSRRYLKIFQTIAKKHRLTIPNINLSDNKTSKDAQFCIKLYCSQPKDTERMAYYNGWVYQNKSGKDISLNLVSIYDTYGKSFCDVVHKRLCNYLTIYIDSSAQTTAYKLIQTLQGLTLLFITENELRAAMKSHRSVRTMMSLFEVLLEQRLNNLDEYNKGKKKEKTLIEAAKKFFNKWGVQIKYFTDCFIKSGEFEEPNKPFICPVFKQELAHRNTSVGGDVPNNISSGIFGHIPLEIKDEEALTIIHDRINRDIEHICIIAKQWLDDIIIRLDNVDKYKKTGNIKPYRGFTRLPFYIGKDHPANTVATYYYYKYDAPCSNYNRFLQIFTKDALNLFALPTADCLYALCILLIHENPSITPAWLDKWELYDKSDNQVGFKQVGNQWVAVSYKYRKGTSLAQQSIILNDFSKSIIETIIRYTQFTRSYLKEKGDRHYRFMLLVSSLRSARKPVDIGQLTSGRVFDGSNTFNLALHTDSYDKDKNIVLTQPESKRLVSSIHLRPFRTLRALQIYLETRSIKAVSNALDHKDTNMGLLESYLPKPIMDFFNDRWVRIFQNALIFEAMKDSILLHSALDFDTSKLDAFLANHKLKSLPERLSTIKSHKIDDKTKLNAIPTQLVFIISAGLLQILIAIVNIVENIMPDEEVPLIVEKWYESACFILSWLDANTCEERRLLGNAIPEIDNLYRIAQDNPLCPAILKEQLCR